MAPSTAESPNGVALVAAAAALLPIPAKQSQICTPIFAADIDSAEKGTIATAIVSLEMKRSSAPKTSEVPAPPIDEAEKRAEQTAASSTGVSRYTEILAAVDGAMKELADQETSGRN
jgi:hypothetical protein